MTNIFLPLKMIPDTLKKNASIYFVVIFFTYINTSMSVTISNIYKLAKIYDTYDDYVWTAPNKNTDALHYEKLYDEKSFFETIHNPKAQRILIASNLKFDYNEYSKKYDDYCNTKYTSYELHSRKIQLHNFRKGATKLIGCLNESQNTNPNLKYDLKECLDITSKGCNFCGLINLDSIKSPLKKIVKCFIAKLKDEQKTALISCMDDFYVHMPVTDENKTTTKLSKKTDKNTPMSPEDEKLKKLRLKDINLLKDVLRKERNLNDDTLDSMFQNYTKLSLVNNTAALKADCTYYKRNMKMYTATQMMYKILPSKDDDFDMFIAKLKQVLSHLRNIDRSTENENSLYKHLEENFASINHEHFKKLKSRRAMERESEYTVYAIRLLLQGYMPLLMEHWQEERQNLKKYKKDIDLEESLIDT